MDVQQRTENIQSPPQVRPFTGAEYLESLKDEREVYIYGERVRDLTQHPAFRNAARMLARLYDALHDPARKDVLTAPTDTGSGGYTHKFYRAPRNAEEMVADRDAIAEWARVSYGWIGRSPDYKAAFLATLDGKVYDLKPGDVVWTGVGCVHSFKNVGTVPVRWLETFAPQPPKENVFRFMAEWDKKALELEGRK